MNIEKIKLITLYHEIKIIDYYSFTSIILLIEPLLYTLNFSQMKVVDIITIH